MIIGHTVSEVMQQLPPRLEQDDYAYDIEYAAKVVRKCLSQAFRAISIVAVKFRYIDPMHQTAFLPRCSDGIDEGELQSV